MKAKDLQHMTKAQLIERVRKLEASAEKADQHAANELRLVQELTRTQSEQLMQAQRQLAESRDRFIELYHSAPVAFATLDRNGIIEEINYTGLLLLGLERERIVKRPLMIFVVKDDRQRFLEHMTRCRATDHSCVTELRLQVKGASPVVVQLTTRPGTRARLGGTCYLTAITDLTEIKALEAERQRMAIQEQAAQAASEAKDRFLAVLSHELRTPLTPILAIVSSLARHNGLPDALKSDLAMVQRNVQMEALLIDDLLDVTRIARNKLSFNLQVVDAHHVVRETARMLASDMDDRDLRVKLELDAAQHTVWADAGRLRQVLWNLLTNAIKFTPDGGTITIRTQNRTPSAGIHYAEPGPRDSRIDGALEIEVSDTGIGIEADVLPRLFKPFEQASHGSTEMGGLGLGLSICRGLVDAHGGRIRVASAGRGHGTIFTVELATLAAPAAEAQPTQPPVHLRNVDGKALEELPKLRILLVEDHPDTARIMSQLLKNEGHSVRVAHSAAAALREAEHPVDLVISDIGLPDGTGLDVMRQICSKRVTRGIALSGFGSDADVHKSREAGFDEHLTKPIDFSCLLEAIHRLSAAAVS